MIALANIDVWLRLTGVLDEGHVNSNSGRVRRTIVRLAFAVLIFPQCLYVKELVTDTFETVFVAITTIAFLSTYLQFAVLVANRRRIRELLSRINHLVRLPTSRSSCAHFQLVEGRLDRLCRQCDRAVMFSLAFYMLMPVGRTAYAVLTDSVTDRTFTALYYDKYYYIDMSAEAQHRAAWLSASTVLASWATYVNATVFIAVPQLFGGLCVYVRAMYDELFAQLAEMDARAGSAMLGAVRANRVQTAAEMRSCIRYHTSILDIVSVIQRIFGGVIALQFAYCLISLSLCVFLVSYTGFAEGSVVLVISGCILSTLFVYCWLGTLLIAKGDELQSQIYGSISWWTYSVAEQRRVAFMLMRSQRNWGIIAFDYFHCTAETFANIISNVFSAITFLKNML